MRIVGLCGLNKAHHAVIFAIAQLFCYIFVSDNFETVVPFLFHYLHIIYNHQNTHTHTHNHFTALSDFVWYYPREPAPVLVTFSARCLQCFDAVGWAAGRASGL